MSQLLNSIKLCPNFVGKYNKKFVLKYVKSVFLVDYKSYSQKLSPHVSLPYSHAFGRSDRQLQYLRIGDLLTQRAQTVSNNIAFISEYENISKTFSQLNEDVNRLAKGLYDLGLRKGDVVGLWSCNSYAWVQTQYACARLGVILCTVNPVYQSPELNYALKKGQIKAIFMPGNGSKQEVVNKYQNILTETLKMPQNKEEEPLILKNVILMDGSEPSKDDNNYVNYIPFNNLTANDGIISSQVTDAVSPDDPAIIMFTSGTTGKPKGAYSSHYTIVNNTILCGEMFDFDDKQISMCIPLPFFHSFAAVLGNISMCGTPFKSVIPNLKYDVKLIVETMIKHECTHIIVTPTQIIDILNYVETNKLQIPSLKGTLIGGAPVPVEVAHNISRVIPSVDDIRIGYGATELGPCTTACHKNDTFNNRMETVGSPLDLVEVKIVNPATGQITKIGEQGELLSRGHNVMIGYWKDEVKTREAIDEGKWYHSGDLATMDQYGYIKIVGRTKELIIRGGENIYPREVEELLHTHPAVFDAYVVGVPDERSGEEVCAWVQLKNKNEKITEQEIREFCKQRISYFKVPRYVLFVDGFPMTPTGKAKKFEMRDQTCKILGLKQNQPKK
ncbi:putative acyl-CoA synthetase YngI [Oppia nitens]|uniref:putative acyl-CoA synthetase YngI n=1 Tax=Oppia nitens TaxID=1686743 RepID=UPI0023DA88FB|nr:putative acyl-CoA synthetase YngI [Oppia nitens]